MIDEESEDADGPSAELADRLAAPIDPRDVRMRHSILKQIALSPAHLYHACQQPQDDSLGAKLGSVISAKSRSEALRFGTACHSMLLGSAHTVDKINARRRTKAWESQERALVERGVKTILNDREHDLATSVVDAVKRNELAMEMLTDGTFVEHTIEWDRDGRAWRATPDARTTRRIVDLKTARSSNPAFFAREALRMHYDTQLRLYSEAAKHDSGIAIDECVLVVVEKTPPFPVTVFRLADEVLERADRILRLWTEQLAVCEATCRWPEYSSAIVPIELDEERWEAA